MKMTDTRIVLFLCTGNSARSIMAEALLNRLGEGRFKAYSAGSFPARTVHPLTIQLLRNKGFDVNGLRSKSWDEFATAEAPKMDFVITVCDNAANEPCPIWPGRTASAHWAFDDPVAAADVDRQEAFERVFLQIEARVRRLVAVSPGEIDKEALGKVLRALSESL